jgi:zinc transport system ATP-binding protein
MALMSIPIVTIEDVSFAYNGQTVLENVRLDIEQGDFIAMIGPNGGGKTTLLKLILGLLRPDRGVIRVFGQTPRHVSPLIGYVPQDVHINRSFPVSAMDVVLMGKLGPGRRRWRRHCADDRDEAMATLERLKVDNLAAKRIGALSGGQRQRVFIARALVTRPALLLLDEPTASIDTKGQADFYALLKELNSQVTILVVSHDLLVISTFVKSVACVNKSVHHHHQAEITGEMLEAMYPCTPGQVCPVELVAHGLPHRVLKDH